MDYKKIALILGLNLLAPTPGCELLRASTNWRRVRDSNPRGLSPTCFPSKRHRPLGELSNIINCIF